MKTSKTRAMGEYGLLLLLASRPAPLAWFAAILILFILPTVAGSARGPFRKPPWATQMQQQSLRSCPPAGNSNPCNGLCEPSFRSGSHEWCQTDPTFHKLSWLSGKSTKGSDFLVCCYEFDKKLKGVNEVYLDFSGGYISGSSGGKLILAVYDDAGNPPEALFRAKDLAAELTRSKRYFKIWTGVATIPGVRVAVKFAKPAYSCSVVLVGIDSSATESVSIRLNGLRVSTRPSATKTK